MLATSLTDGTYFIPVVLRVLFDIFVVAWKMQVRYGTPGITDD